MKKTIKFAAALLAVLTVGCSDDNPVSPVTPSPGEDVSFGVSFEESGVKSRTIYGDLVGNSYPVKWVKGDQMLVMSPQCAPDHGQYEVGTHITGEGTNTSSEYAGVLQKIGGAGVQWGNAATADFYSVYPYKKVWNNNGVPVINPATRTVTMSMPHIQNDYIYADNEQAGKYSARPDMDAALLYAQTTGVANGSTVNLKYASLSTGLRFTLRGPSSGQAGASATTIQMIRFISGGTKIAGKMDVVFPAEGGTKPTVSFDATESYDHVIVYSSYQGAQGGGFLTLNPGESMKDMNAFVMLEKETDIKNWTIEVTTLNATYSLSLSKFIGNNSTLVPGKIHDLGELPHLNPDTESEWEVQNWMVNIPRNTYITEISLPGSWNSLNKDAQGNNPSIASQYALGARAFHLDCRYKRTVTSIFPLRYSYELGIADGGNTTNGNNKYMTDASTPTFATALGNVTANVKNDEYMVVLCTFAQNSGAPDGKNWYGDVSSVCATNDKVIDARTLTENSTVGDVLGKVIVIVNMEGAPSTWTGVPADSKCFFVNAPLTLTADMFTSADSYNKDKLWAGGKEGAVTFYNTQAQICGNTSSVDAGGRGYGPSLAERKTVAGGILDWSHTNYGKTDYNHSTYLYMGLGGYYKSGNSELYTAVAADFNNWIKGKVDNMSATPIGNQTNYFPVGIVLMNMVTTTTSGTYNINGPETMKSILLLNSKYQKEYDPNKPAWPDAGTTPANSPANYSSSHVNGGNAWIVNQ